MSDFAPYIKKEQSLGTDKPFAVTIKKIGEFKVDKFGKRTAYGVVEHNGKEYGEFFKEKYQPIVVTGGTLTGIRKLFDGKPYCEWYSGGDGMTQVAEPKMGYESSLDQPPPPTQEVYKEKPQSSVGTRAGRGAAWNNAFLYILELQKLKREDFTLGDFLKDVDRVASIIEPCQEKFVNGE